MGFDLHTFGATTYLRWLTWRRGELVGRDDEGNGYYRDRKGRRGRRERRWVVYRGEAEASRVPPGWHAWLHHQTDEPPRPDASRPPWVKEHVPNLTGTMAAYRPLGSTLRGGRRASATGDYEPWTPS